MIVGIDSIAIDYHDELGPIASNLLPEFDVIGIELFWSMCIAIENVRALVLAKRHFGNRLMVVCGVHVALR